MSPKDRPSRTGAREPRSLSSLLQSHEQQALSVSNCLSSGLRGANRYRLRIQGSGLCGHQDAVAGPFAGSLFSKGDGEPAGSQGAGQRGGGVPAATKREAVSSGRALCYTARLLRARAGYLVKHENANRCPVSVEHWKGPFRPAGLTLVRHGGRLFLLSRAASRRGAKPARRQATTRARQRREASPVSGFRRQST